MMKNYIFIAGGAALAAGVIWLFTSEKVKTARKAIADKSCEVADTVNKAIQKIINPGTTEQQPAGNA